MKIDSLDFVDGPAGKLEILAEGFDTFQKGIAIVCHPHPLHSGTMHNKVVNYLARTLRKLGLATIRFNYRGVEKSDGSYGEGIGETEDLLAIVDLIKKDYPDQPIWLAGFSFGSYVVLRAANERDIKQVITVAPAINRLDFNDFALPTCPWLLIHGTADEIVPFEEVEPWVNKLEQPPKTIYLDGVSHFFHGQLVRLQDEIINALQTEAEQLRQQ